MAYLVYQQIFQMPVFDDFHIWQPVLDKAKHFHIPVIQHFQMEAVRRIFKDGHLRGGFAHDISAGIICRQKPDFLLPFLEPGSGQVAINRFDFLFQNAVNGVIFRRYPKILNALQIKRLERSAVVFHDDEIPKTLKIV